MLLNLAGFIVLGVLIAAAEMPALLKEKQNKDRWMFILLLGAGIVMNAATILEPNIPSPLNWIMAIYGPISNTILNLLS